ncbi:MAG: hypothetical protein CMI18_04640 [Opitutaceae bacterium]|nr:hypothetical protein [Opitutaceae bacterium]
MAEVLSSRPVLVFFVIFLVTGCAKKKSGVAERGLVVSANAIASEIGIEIMKQGVMLSTRQRS